MDDQTLTYIEKAARDNLDGHRNVADMIQRESNVLLALVLSGAAGALAYSAQSSAMANAMSIPSIVTSVYLFLIAVVVAAKCLSLREYPALTNEPRNLLVPNLTFEQIRTFELDNVQKRIDDSVKINGQRADWLNCCRYAAAATPVVAIATWATRHFL
jgi:hypothetical protein